MSNLKSNKKGLSQVIAVVLFILMSLSALVILFGAIGNFLETPGPQLSSTISCVTLQGSPSKIISAEYNEDKLLVEVKRAFSEGTNSFDFILETESGNSERYTCSQINNDVCVNCFIQGIGLEKTFYFVLPDVKKVSLYANGNCLMDEKEIL